MPLITFRTITLGHGALPLIENANLVINQGEHICLIGQNGVGKSTLLKVILGDIDLEAGSIESAPHLKISYLSQTIPHDLEGSITSIIKSAMDEIDIDDWQKNHLVEKIISKLELNANAQFQQLSGGLKRRVLLAKALAIDPDVLLLDEPTNHLDIDAIHWLEKFLINFNKTLIMVTHDRVLMQAVASHIVEIDNGQLLSWKGSYEAYLKHKASILQAEEKANALFDKRLAEEEKWIRQGIKARRTRNEGRVRDLKKMREQRNNRRTRLGTVKISHQEVSTSGKIVFAAEHISFSYDKREIIKDFSTLILRGDKVGIIGANGSGKSTLLNLLLGKLKPTTGTVEHGTKLSVGYFDQHRMDLDLEKSVFDNISEGSDYIEIGDSKKHVMSYLQDFLFSPKKARSPVKVLSGGERNRLMLAKLFSKSHNLLVLDEPTNDLDVETLELLEEQLLNFKGTLLLVSHDRAFLNNVVTSTIVFETDGRLEEYVGGYDDWLRQQKPIVNKEIKITSVPKKEKQEKSSSKSLSYNEQKELNNLPKKIEKLEKQISTLHDKLSDSSLYQEDNAQFTALSKQLTEHEQALALVYERWEFLEGKLTS